MPVSSTGHKAAMNLVASLPAVADAAAIESLNETADRIEKEAINRTLSEFNIPRPELEKAVFVQRASEGRDFATVSLKIKAIPFESFSPQVQMKPVDMLAFGKHRTRRMLPHVSVRYRRGAAAQYVRPAFPVASGSRFKRRTGKARHKLTVLRYFTFPKRHMAKMLPELKDLAGETVSVSFSSAWRSRLGSLRRNG